MRLFKDAVFGQNGRIPVNTDGAHGEGHPVGATGMGQIAELYYQLKGEAGRGRSLKLRLGYPILWELAEIQ